MFAVYENQAIKGPILWNSDPVLLSQKSTEVLVRISIGGGLGHPSLGTFFRGGKKKKKRKE